MKSILKRPSFGIESPSATFKQSNPVPVVDPVEDSSNHTDADGLKRNRPRLANLGSQNEFPGVQTRRSSISSVSDEQMRIIASRGSKQLSVGILENQDQQSVQRVAAQQFLGAPIESGTRPSTCGSSCHMQAKDSGAQTPEPVQVSRPSSSHGKFARFSKVGIAKRPSNSRIFSKQSFEANKSPESSGHNMKSGSTLHLSSFGPVQFIDEEHSPKAYQQKTFAKRDPLNVSLVLPDDELGKEATLKTANTGSSSSLDYAGDEDYFKKVQPVASNSDKFYVENEYGYNLKNFFLFYTVHMLFFNVFGLLMPVLLFPFKSWRTALKNMTIGLYLMRVSLFQNGLWINTVTIVVGYFFWDFRLIGIPTVILSW